MFTLKSCAACVFFNSSFRCLTSSWWCVPTLCTASASPTRTEGWDSVRTATVTRGENTDASLCSWRLIVIELARRYVNCMPVWFISGNQRSVFVKRSRPVRHLPLPVVLLLLLLLLQLQQPPYAQLTSPTLLPSASCCSASKWYVQNNVLSQNKTQECKIFF